MRASISRFLLRVSSGHISRKLPAATLLLVLTVALLAWTPSLRESQAAETTAAEALALDQKILTAAKTDSEIMANLTYLSDIIGPRVTGSPALKQANDWTAEKMKSY